MHRKTLPFALLACVTSAENAAAIEGDLLEQRAARGKVWYALHLIRTVFALLRLAVAQAPFRTAILSACGVAASLLMCVLVGRTFLGPDALTPYPLLGVATIVVCGILIGTALARAAGALGVRAAAGTALLLLAMFVAAYLFGVFGVEPSAEFQAGGWLSTFGSFAAAVALAFCVYPAPLLIASACAHARRL